MMRLYILISFGLLILSLLNSNITLANGDVAEYLNNPIRILNGQIPYHDFWLLFPPGEVYFPALIYRLFGVNINLILYLNIFGSAFVAFISYQIVHQLTRREFSAFATAWLIFFNTVKNIYLVFPIIAFFLLVKFFQQKRQGFIFWAGFFLGLTFWFRIYETLAVCLAFLLSFPLTGYRRQLPRFLTGIFISPLSLCLAFHSILPQMIQQLIFQSLKHGTLWRQPYFIDLKNNLFFLINFIHSSPFNIGYIKGVLSMASRIPATLGLYILPLVTPLFFGKIIFHSSFKKNRPILIFLLLWSIALFPRAIMRGGLDNVAHSLLPIFILSGLLLRLDKPGWFNKLYSICFALSLWSVVFNFLNFTKNILKPRYPIKTNHGILQTISKEKADQINQTINRIYLNSQPGDYIFVTDWELPPLYALTERVNPTYYDSLIDLLAVPDITKENSICQSLQQKPPTVIIHSLDGGIADINRKTYLFSRLTPKLNQCLAELN